MLPMRNPAEKKPDTRPRMSLGAIRISKAIAEMLNIVDPMPPRPRKISSCQ